MTTLPKEILNKEFISQFMTDLHSQLLENRLQAEIDEHLGYEKNQVEGNNSGNSRNGAYKKTISSHYGESIINVPRDRNGEFDPIVIPKHKSTAQSIEELVITLILGEFERKWIISVRYYRLVIRNLSISLIKGSRSNYLNLNPAIFYLHKILDTVS